VQKAAHPNKFSEQYYEEERDRFSYNKSVQYSLWNSMKFSIMLERKMDQLPNLDRLEFKIVIMF